MDLNDATIPNASAVALLGSGTGLALLSPWLHLRVTGRPGRGCQSPGSLVLVTLVWRHSPNFESPRRGRLPLLLSGELPIHG